MVDWVRSSYRSTWVVNPNRPLRVEGRYVFVNDDTPPYPFPHYYGSRHWLNDEEFAVNGLGDQGPDFGCNSPWDNGSGLPQMPAAIILGENCLRFDTPIRLPRACQNRLPLPEFLTVTFGFSIYSVVRKAVRLIDFPGFWRILGLPATVVDANGGNPDGKIVIKAGFDRIGVDCFDHGGTTLDIQAPGGFDIPGDYSGDLRFIRPILWTEKLSLNRSVIQTPAGPIRDFLWMTVAGDQFE